MRKRSKATKDVLQAASLIDYLLATAQPSLFNDAWRGAITRGPEWQARAMQGRDALLKLAPELADPALWAA